MEIIQDKIAQYVAGKLKGEELHSFEKQLQTDSALAAEVALFRQLRKVMQHSEVIDMNRTLTNIHLQMPEHVQPDYSVADEFAPKGTNWRWWGIGVLVVGVLALGMWQLQGNNTRKQLKTFSNTYLKNATPFENIISLGETDNSPLAKGMRFYDEGKYSSAVPYLEEHNNSRNADDFSKLYLGICYLMTDQTEKATTVLLPLSTNKDLELSSTAQWHLALAYLIDSKQEKAKPLLEDLKENTRFGENAKRVLLNLRE